MNEREKTAERLLRRIRQRIFDYDDMGIDMYRKAYRIMARCSERLVRSNLKRRAMAQDRKLQRTPSLFE